MNKLIVFTGGPGAGKTSVIEQLKTQGFICAPETGRQIIQTQVANHGSALPWNDKQAFRDEMMKVEVSNYRAFNVHQGNVFFDRSIVDVYGYSKLEQLPISHELITHCQTLRYHSQVFIFPPWTSIFSNDEERKQDFSEAVATYQQMVNAYHKFGYQLIEVPKMSVEDRVAFIRGSIIE
ncbi:TPA: AAA family ATPase [Vibrio alginolyticus]|uniref:AAA family ATPase n=1 Tax=Vibrio TaxID=662 RepID=UPI00148B37EE|nr:MULTISPECIES: AAA family ATPase [Vibrio]EGX6965049.1 AAA family ATPase [Vibrio alginolyticus]EJU9970463.1 AAA family ATPase [Vibrio alginolyticus]EJX2555127.1 AAA family ATPase [Vibrio alginolyticus]ELA6659345.1 AAA family ATPase [Vibrio alginolyticus]ELA6790491.1 AAA family ATPase [Vibrio alginolyticus]